MVRSGSWVLVVIWFLISCGADEFPERFRGEQVERLLSGGDTSIWSPISILFEGEEQLTSCQDSIRFFITQTQDDSLLVLQLNPSCASLGTFDTLNLGKAKASSEDGIFTDSVLYVSGDFWLIEEVFSQSLSFIDGDFRYRLHKK